VLFKIEGKSASEKVLCKLNYTRPFKGFARSAGRYFIHFLWMVLALYKLKKMPQKALPPVHRFSLDHPCPCMGAWSKLLPAIALFFMLQPTPALVPLQFFLYVIAIFSSSGGGGGDTANQNKMINQLCMITAFAAWSPFPHGSLNAALCHLCVHQC